MAGRQARHQRPVFNGDVNVIRHPAVQFFIGGDGFIDLPGHAQQSRLLQRWRPSPVLLFISLRDAFSSGESGASFVSRSSSLRPGGIP